MSVREYIGARYVPIFADPITWDATRTYEPLTVVLYQGNSYTSRQAVPANIDITNQTYWAQTGNYNAQIEQYRAEVQTFSGRIDAINAALPSSFFNSQNTVQDCIEDLTNDFTSQLDLLRKASVAVFNTVAEMVSSTVTLNAGDYVSTLGFASRYDGGGATYLISDTGVALRNLMIELNSGKFASLVITEIMSVKQFGAKGLNDQVETAYFNDCFESAAKCVIIPRGTYRAYMNVSRSNTTVLCLGNPIIDGVVHIAIGEAETPIYNVKFLGEITSTVRFGSFYCRSVYLDTLHLIANNPIYVHQTAEGGQKGLHFYTDSQNMFVQNLTVDGASRIYAAGLDTEDNSLPVRNIHFGNVTITASSVLGFSASHVAGLIVDNLYVEQATATVTYATFIGNCQSVNIKRLHMRLLNAALGCNLQENSHVIIDAVELVPYSNADYGLRIANTDSTVIGTINMYNGNTAKGVWIQSRVTIGQITVKNVNCANAIVFDTDTIANISEIMCESVTKTLVQFLNTGKYHIGSVLAYGSIAGGCYCIVAEESNSERLVCIDSAQIYIFNQGFRLYATNKILCGNVVISNCTTGVAGTQGGTVCSLYAANLAFRNNTTNKNENANVVFANEV